MPQIIINLKTAVVIGLVIFVLLHLTLYYAMNFNLTMWVVEKLLQLADFVKWLIEKMVK